MSDRRWYVIQTYSGLESSVKEELERRRESYNLQDYIFEIIIPEETVMETKSDGSKKEKVKKMFPGYVFVEMIVTDDSWFVVRNTPKVTGFLGSSGNRTKPVPIARTEIDVLLKKVGIIKEAEIDVEVGEKVRVVSGPFKDKIGEVSAVNVEKRIVTISIDMFGRDTPTDFEYSQIEKLGN